MFWIVNITERHDEAKIKIIFLERLNSEINLISCFLFVNFVARQLGEKRFIHEPFSKSCSTINNWANSEIDYWPTEQVSASAEFTKEA